MQVFSDDYVRGVLKQIEDRSDKEFADIVNNFSYNGLYKRRILDPKVRQLCAISALTAINALPQLQSHIRGAFNAGATEAEVKEAIIQTATYCGMPYGNQALGACEQVLKELGGKTKG